jgi:hypothetical protein
MTASAIARLDIASDADAPESAHGAASPGLDMVTVFVRFGPNAGVLDISDRPDGLTKEQWVKPLHTHAGDRYQSRAGGRGFFKISSAELERLKALPPL